jgi:hypothetical protein
MSPQKMFAPDRNRSRMRGNIFCGAASMVSRQMP